MLTPSLLGRVAPSPQLQLACCGRMAGLLRDALFCLRACLVGDQGPLLLMRL